MIKHKKHKKQTKTEKTNIWMIISAALLVLLIASFVTEGLFVRKIGAVEAKNKAESIVDILVQGAVPFQISNVKYENGLYSMELYIEGEVINSFMTRDGKFFFPQGIDIGLLEEQLNSMMFFEEEPIEDMGEIDEAELAQFINCLEENQVRIYGANWCGYTNALVDNLGGYSTISPIYVECTREQSLCSNEGIQGYPTIKINGEVINIQRTIEGFAQATGCTAPNGRVQVVTNPDIGC